MTEDLIRQLMAAGLTKQQASSVTAETLVNLFMPDDGKVLIREAQGQVAEMRQLVNDLILFSIRISIYNPLPTSDAFD